MTNTEKNSRRAEADEKKRALSVYLEALKELHYWHSKLASLRANGVKITANLSGMPTGGGGATSKTALLVEQLDAAERKEAAALAVARTRHAEVSALIDTVQEADQRNVLRCRYIDGLTWEQAAERLGFSRQWTTLKHGEALRALQLPPKN